MTRSEIRKKVFKIIAGQLKTNPYGIKPKSIRVGSFFFDDLGLDSLGVVEIIDELETEFNLSIP